MQRSHLINLGNDLKNLPLGQHNLEFHKLYEAIHLPKKLTEETCINGTQVGSQLHHCMSFMPIIKVTSALSGGTKGDSTSSWFIINPIKQVISDKKAMGHKNV